jgi:hypothetical protein
MPQHTDPEARVNLTVRLSPASWRKLLREYAWRNTSRPTTMQELFEELIATLPERPITDEEAELWTHRA